MKTYDAIAKDFTQAELLATNFFIEMFNHSGNVGYSKKTIQCECGESLLVEFYSKDDPAMDDTYKVLICENCYNNNPKDAL